MPLHAASAVMPPPAIRKWVVRICSPRFLSSGPGFAVAYLGQELASHRGVIRVAAAPEGRHGLRVLLANAAHLRAEVDRLQMHGDAMRLHQLDERVCDLLAQAL